MISVGEVAEMLEISALTVVAQCAQHGLPCLDGWLDPTASTFCALPGSAAPAVERANQPWKRRQPKAGGPSFESC